jgi:hypothetical protein
MTRIDATHEGEWSAVRRPALTGDCGEKYAIRLHRRKPVAGIGRHGGCNRGWSMGKRPTYLQGS